MMIELALWSAVAPLALALVSGLWSYPALLEEVVKWAILKYVAAEQVLRAKSGAVVGLVFGISELVLYSFNAWNGAQWESLGLRLLLTVPMHTLTGAIIAWSVGRQVGYAGVAAAMAIHATFNYLMIPTA